MATPTTVHQLASNRRGSDCHSVMHCALGYEHGDWDHAQCDSQQRTKTHSGPDRRPALHRFINRPKMRIENFVGRFARCAIQPIAQDVGLHVAAEPHLGAQYDRVAIRRRGCRLNENAAVRQQLHRIAPSGRQAAARRTRRCAQRGHIGGDRSRPTWHDQPAPATLSRPRATERALSPRQSRG